MENQVQETGMDRYRKLKAEAKELGITGNMNTEKLEEAIAAKKIEVPVVVDELAVPVASNGITADEAKKIEARLRFEDETRERIISERRIITDRAEIIAESESLCIPVDLPDSPTELDLARARRTLGLKKREEKPSPETLGIEASKRGYYVFTNREDDDANHTVNLGGKYIIHLIANQVHVLSAFHIKRWKKCAVTPNYQRVSTGVEAGPGTVGRAAEICTRVGDKPRFMFEYLGEAPQNAPFGLVTDVTILDELDKE